MSVPSALWSSSHVAHGPITWRYLVKSIRRTRQNSAFCWSPQQGVLRRQYTIAKTSDREAGSAPSSSATSTSKSSLVGLLENPAIRREITRSESAEECLYAISGQISARSEEVDDPGVYTLSEEDIEHLLQSTVSDGNAKLALDMYGVLSRGQLGTLPLKWTLRESQVRSFLLILFIRSLHMEYARRLLQSSFRIQLPGVGELTFGNVVPCPNCKKSSDKDQALTVVKPSQGLETVPCSECRYEFEVFSGTITRSQSDAAVENQSIFKFLQGKNASSTHTVDLQAPDGTSRTYKFATSTNTIPAKMGERVSIVSSPPKKDGVLLPPRPLGWKENEARGLYNHVQKELTELLRVPKEGGSPMSWAVPAVMLFAGGDLASTFIDKDLPALILASAIGITAASLVSKNVVLPSLAKLPSNSLAKIEYRQQFLAQYSDLRGKLDGLLSLTYEDMQLLNQLWQLHYKMEAVGGSQAYDARKQKVLSSAYDLEDGLKQRMELIDGYTKVANMIEIEIELETDINAAEARSAVSGISEQMEKLSELESLKAEWTIQVESKDEIEKLLRDY